MSSKIIFSNCVEEEIHPENKILYNEYAASQEVGEYRDARNVHDCGYENAYENIPSASMKYTEI